MKLKEAFKPEVLDVLTEEILFSTYRNLEEEHYNLTNSKTPMYYHNKEEEVVLISNTMSSFRDVLEYYLGSEWYTRYNPYN